MTTKLFFVRNRLAAQVAKRRAARDIPSYLQGSLSPSRVKTLRRRSRTMMSLRQTASSSRSCRTLLRRLRASFRPTAPLSAAWRGFSHAHHQ